MGCKKFQRVHHKPFLITFQIFVFILLYAKRLILQTDPFFWINLYEPCFSEMVTKSLQISVFIWNDLVLAPKRSKKCTSNHFDKFSASINQFTIGQTFTSVEVPFFLNPFIRTAFPPKV